MSADDLALRMLAGSATAAFAAGVGRLVAAHPHPHGARLRVTVTVADSGEQLGQVDVDVTNLWDLGRFADRRAVQTFEPVPQPRRLRLVAADDHGKTKEPLPRGPHPYPTGVA
jgi:hypothetical protein